MIRAAQVSKDGEVVKNPTEYIRVVCPECVVVSDCPKLRSGGKCIHE